MTKTCKVCNQELNVDQFEKGRLKCRSCRRIYSKQVYEKNKDRYKRQANEYRKKNPDKHALYQKNSTKNNAEKRRNWYLLSNYGITSTDYNELLNRQKGNCAICNKPDSKNIRLAVDHCHDTGKIRGLLCHTCNMSLGLLNDSIDHFKKSLNYLQKFKK